MLTTDIIDRRVEPWIGIAGRANGTSGRVFGASAGDIGTAAPDIQTVARDIRIAAPASRRPAAAIRSSAPATGTTADANFEPARLNPTPARDIDAAACGNWLPAPRNRLSAHGIREPHVSIGHRHQPLKSSQLPIPLRHVAIRWRHQPINCPHRTIRFRHLSREWLHSGLKISTVTARDSRPRFCLSTAPAAHVPGQPHISLRSFRLDAANRTLHKGDEDTDLLQPSKRRRASLHRRRKRSSGLRTDRRSFSS